MTTMDSGGFVTAGAYTAMVGFPDGSRGKLPSPSLFPLSPKVIDFEMTKVYRDGKFIGWNTVRVMDGINVDPVPFYMPKQTGDRMKLINRYRRRYTIRKTGENTWRGERKR